MNLTLKSIFRKREKTSIKEVFRDEEIQFSLLLRLFYDRLNVILLFLVFTWILAAIHLLTTPNMYTSRISVISEVQPVEMSRSRFSFQAITGSGADNSGSGSLSNPEFYSKILGNDLFLLKFMDLEFRYPNTGIKGQQKLGVFLVNYVPENLLQLMLKDLTSGNWSFPLSRKKFSKKLVNAPPVGFGEKNYKGGSLDSVIFVSQAQKKSVKALRGMVDIKVEGQFFNLSVTAPTINLSSVLTKVILDSLMAEVLFLKTRKEKINADYLERRTILAKANLLEAQDRLSKHIDANSYSVSADVKWMERVLTNEFNTQSQIYAQLSSQLEQKRIQLQESAPIHTVFEPIYLPLKEDSKNLSLTIILYSFGGIVLGFIWIFGLILKVNLFEKDK